VGGNGKRQCFGQCSVWKGFSSTLDYTLLGGERKKGTNADPTPADLLAAFGFFYARQGL
jgi:hypothetical protein